MRLAWDEYVRGRTSPLTGHREPEPCPRRPRSAASGSGRPAFSLPPAPPPPGLAVGAPRLPRLSRNLPEHRVPACLLRSGPYQSLSTVLLEYANFCVVFESVRGRDWASTSEGTQWPLISYSGPFCVCRSAAVMASENKVWARGAGWAWVQTHPRGADPRVYSLLPFTLVSSHVLG